MKKAICIIITIVAILVAATGASLLHPGVRNALNRHYRTWRMSSKRSSLRPYAYGIDLSHHNGKINWDKLEISFIYLKATEGATVKDSCFQRFMGEAKKRNIAVGAYHFLTTARSAEAQFANFRSVVGKGQTDLVPVIDYEEDSQSPHHRISQDSVCSLILRFSQLCEKHYGKKPIIYSTDNILRSLSSKLEGHEYWTSVFSSDPKVKFRIHQIGILGVPGIRKVDVDTLNCPLDDIRL